MRVVRTDKSRRGWHNKGEVGCYDVPSNTPCAKLFHRPLPRSFGTEWAVRVTSRFMAKKS